MCHILIVKPFVFRRYDLKYHRVILLYIIIIIDLSIDVYVWIEVVILLYIT